MTDQEIGERARKVYETFLGEAARFYPHDEPMESLLAGYASIAKCVAVLGEYHREYIFKRMVAILERLGVDVSGADTSDDFPSTGVFGAAGNAIADTNALYKLLNPGDDRDLWLVVAEADGLMGCLVCDEVDVDVRAERFHEVVVTHYISERTKRDAAGPCQTYKVDVRKVLEWCDECGALCKEVGDPLTSAYSFPHSDRTFIVREVPERVIFNPPATIAFWKGGAKTVARCAEGEEFSEYVGLLVCMAKRHTLVPKHAMFEDVMAKLLKRAERQQPKRKTEVA